MQAVDPFEVLDAYLEAHKLSMQRQDTGADVSNEEEWPPAWSVRHHKTYPRLSKVRPAAPEMGGSPLGDLLHRRKSWRSFSNAPAAAGLLTTLLRRAVGMEHGKDGSLRAMYPSAGGRYPIEVYATVRNTDGLSDGLFHYNAYLDQLTLLLHGDVVPLLSRCGIGDVESPNWVFFLTGVFHRTCIKYGGRGYRFVLMEAGIVAHNIALASLELGLGSVLLGGFHDDADAELLDVSLDLEQEAPLLLVAVGRR